MDDLDRIPWKDLTHAYGSAEDVPDLLRRLSKVSSNDDDGDSALGELFGNIWHQGTVYEATPYAVPFLLKLVTSSQTHDRVGILSLLAEIARGSPYSHLLLGFHAPADLEAQKMRERAWVAQSHSAVAAGFVGEKVSGTVY